MFDILRIFSSIHVPKLCRSTHIQTECDVTYKIFWNSNLHAFVVYVRRHNVEEGKRELQKILAVAQFAFCKTVRYSLYVLFK